MNRMTPTRQDIEKIKEALPKIREFAWTFYDPNDDLHGIGHIKRVLVNAHKIFKKYCTLNNISRENTLHPSWELIEAITYLHDIGRKKEKELKEEKNLQHKIPNHAEISAEISHSFLLTLHLKKEIIDYMVEGIRAHSFSLRIKPPHIEAIILSDADKLDAIGAIGVFRAAVYQAQNNKGISEMLKHFHEKLLILDKQIILPIAREMAYERIDFLRIYERTLLNEISDESLDLRALQENLP